MARSYHFIYLERSSGISIFLGTCLSLKKVRAIVGSTAWKYSPK